MGGDDDDRSEEERRAERRAARKRKSGWDQNPDDQDLTPIQRQAIEATKQMMANRAAAAAGQKMAGPRMGEAVPSGRLYVGSLNYDIKDTDLRPIFAPFGAIKAIDMSYEPATGKSKGFGFVEFYDGLHAEACQKAMNGFNLGGRAIKIGRPHHTGPQSREAMGEEKRPYVVPMAQLGIKAGNTGLSQGPPTRIYVGSVFFDIGENELKAVFGAFGPVRSVSMIPNPETGKHKGYGFVDFEEHASAVQAISTMNGFDLAGRQLKVGWANSATGGAAGFGDPTGGGAVAIAAQAAQAAALTRVTAVIQGGYLAVPNSAQMMQNLAASTPTQVICLKNMVDPEEVDADLESEITEECSKYGKVDQVVIAKLDEEGTQIVKILVSFGDTESAGKAVNSLDKRWFGGKIVKATFYPVDKFQAKDWTA